jgi:hypothetical protein
MTTARYLIFKQQRVPSIDPFDTEESIRRIASPAVYSLPLEHSRGLNAWAPHSEYALEDYLRTDLAEIPLENSPEMIPSVPLTDSSCWHASGISFFPADQSKHARPPAPVAQPRGQNERFRVPIRSSKELGSIDPDEVASAIQVMPHDGTPARKGLCDPQRLKKNCLAVIHDRPSCRSA